MGETLGCALLDTGCSKSVCSDTWLDEYLLTLNEIEKSLVKYSNSNSIFRFGDSTLYKATGHVKLPAHIAGKRFLINADTINADIPLLLSKGAMKKAGVVIDLKNDEIQMFGKKVKVFQTKIGHCCVALNKKVMMGQME